MIKASAGDKLGRGMSYYMVGGELARTLGPIMLSAIHELDTKMPTFINSVYMNINFSISSIVVLAMGMFGDTIGLHTTYTIAAFLAYIAIGFALYLNSAILKVQRI